MPAFLCACACLETVWAGIALRKQGASRVPTLLECKRASVFCQAVALPQALIRRCGCGRHESWNVAYKSINHSLQNFTSYQIYSRHGPGLVWGIRHTPSYKNGNCWTGSIGSNTEPLPWRQPVLLRYGRWLPRQDALIAALIATSTSIPKSKNNQIICKYIKCILI